MAIEIERKYLLANESWREQVQSSQPMRQGYMIGSEKASVRVRISGNSAKLNIKSAELGITRKEYEVDLPLDDAREILDSLCQKPVLEKTRYLVPMGKHTWEIDEFEGENQGLIVAEIELSSVDEEFAKPDWLGAEVSDDPRYYNVSLAKHPYKNW